MSHDFDAIVIGARCVGAPTALLVARQGRIDAGTLFPETLVEPASSGVARMAP